MLNKYKVDYAIFNNSQDNEYLLTNSIIEVKNGKIFSVKKTKGKNNKFISIIIPSPINSHSHLELYDFQTKKFNNTKIDFINWLKNIIDIRSNETNKNAISKRKNLIKKAVFNSLSNACGVIVNFISEDLFYNLHEPFVFNSNTFSNKKVQSENNIQARILHAVELIDARKPLSYKQWRQKIAKLHQHWQSMQKAGWLGAFGLAPHAPYSASLSCYLACADAAKAGELDFLSSHILESMAEKELFINSKLIDDKNSILNLLRSLPVDENFAREISSPIKLAQKLIAFSQIPGALLAHGNELQIYDENFFHDLFNNRIILVHCPSTHEFFQRKIKVEFLRKFIEYGTLALGGDSPASGGVYNIYAEAEKFSSNFPNVNFAGLLRRNVAKTLQATGISGVLQIGAAADFSLWKIPRNLLPHNLTELFANPADLEKFIATSKISKSLDFKMIINGVEMNLPAREKNI